MTTYTVSAVNPKTKPYTTQFGDMVGYMVKFAEDEDTIQISRKSTSPAPKVGDVLEGTVSSDDFGKKFKAEYKAGSAPKPAYQGNGGRSPSDPFTMYLSYAKDIAVALIASKNGFNEEEYAARLESVLLGGKTLYYERPGAEPEEVRKDKVLSAEDIAEIEKKFEQAVSDNKQAEWPE